MKKSVNNKIILFCKKTIFCNYAIEILKSTFDSNKIAIIQGGVGEKFNEIFKWGKPKYIISFLSPWIIPERILNKVDIASINFHPGSPKYPGAGCYSFALYEQATEYGVTCHHMNKKVDSGEIIMTSYFNISINETVETLKLKSMIHLLFLFQKVIYLISGHKKLPSSNEKWEREQFTRKQLNELCRIDPFSMNKDEIIKRIKATSYPKAPGTYINIHGTIFKYPIDQADPIV